MKNAIMFALAITATRAEVEETIDAIRRQYNAPADIGTVAPTDITSTHTAAPPAAAVTPPAAANGSTPPAATAELDKNGLPWDERIHSGNHAKIADGSWRKRKGVDAGLVTKVEAELRATLGAPPAAATPPVAAAITQPAAPALPGAPSLPAPPAATAINPAFTAFVDYVASNMQTDANPQGRITDDWMQAVLKHYGVADGSLQNLAHRVDLIPAIEGYVRQALAS